MNPRMFALVGGILMVAVGVLAMIPALNVAPLDAGLPPLYVETSYGLFLNYLPMNIFNKAALIVFGVAGIMASRLPTTALPASISYARWVMGVMGALAVLGLIPQTNTLFGYWPLFGADIALHAVVAVVGAYYGFALPAKAHKENAWLRRDLDQSKVA